MINRKIPATMATQHPDHAARPYWHTSPFIPTQKEAEELFLSFSELGITEYKWDWEGKLVDESVLERLFGEHFAFFKKYPLGQERFLTFRLPNPKVQTEFRIGRAFMNLASAASVARHFNLPSPPLFEVILPMTESADAMLEIQVAYQDIHHLKHSLYRLDGILTTPRIIPLFEQVATIINSDKILEQYFSMYKKTFKKLPPYMRPYVARSDPALNSGIVPTVIAIKIALSRYKLLAKKHKIPLYPIIGAAALPFRGGISPLTVKQFADEYKGIRTTTIQSAFRYDYEKDAVIKAIKFLEKNLSKQEAVTISKSEEKVLLAIIPHFEKAYKQSVENIAPLINTIASFLPKRRERVQHIGLFGYSRGIGKVKLPRAISFTAALYSLGIPPELIGTGRGLRSIKKEEMEIVKKHYIYLQQNLEQAGRYLNKEVLIRLAKKSSGWKDIVEDVKEIETLFGITLGPKTEKEKQHQALSFLIYEKIIAQEVPEELITDAALLRRSIG